ncbi:GNAT family N-acetyltransferase [Pelagibacterium luteolum]|uniref:Predicted N-acyltransferase, GNAT family n=1 Tax=Pelagibacterium luteolum TaxID=440168 RepID=A0A1G7VKY3_9HYPH|nr:GNAT family N-acetyltransferase [Pelagibacterium luteolum]SDG60228.1 Predicted N-acyltransferase, GNAT family [Pelagibacterium luteolum]
MSQPGCIFLTVPVFSPLCNLGFALRREVFIIEQNVPEELEHDTDDMTATHVVGIMDGAVVAVARILFKEQHAKIGRVAVAASHRGLRLGAQLIDYAVEVAHQHGETRCYLESQADKIGFYARLGFVAFGDEFMDAGIPHLKMKNY